MDTAIRYATYVLAGIRNRPGRNLAAVFCFALLAANVFSGQYLVAGEVASLDQGVGRMGADLLVVPLEYTKLLQDADADNTVAIVAVQPSAGRFDGAFLETVKTVPGVAGASQQLYVGTASVPEVASAPVPVYGIDPGTDFTVGPWLSAPLDLPLGPGEALAGHDLGRSPGSVLPIAGRPFRVVGVLDPTRSAIDGSIFVAMDGARSLALAGGVTPPGPAPVEENAVSGVLVRVAPGADADQVAFALTRLAAPSGLSVIARHFSLDPVSAGLRELPGFLATASAIVLVAAFPLIALIAAMVAGERRRELGLLRAMGARSAVVVLLVMAESLALAALGAVAGIAASLAALSLLAGNGVLSGALQVSFRQPPGAEVVIYAAATLLVIVAMATLSSAYPAFRVGQMNPFDAIRADGD